MGWEVLGNINYYLDNELVFSANLVAEKDISKKNILNMFNFTVQNWFSILRK